MSLRDVRLRYSIMVNYTSTLFRIAASMGFLIIVARKLDPVEFGLWGFILVLSNILAWPIRLWTFWAQRHVVYEYKHRIEHYRGTVSTAFFLTTLYTFIVIGLLIGVGYGFQLMMGYGFYYFIYAIPMAVSITYAVMMEDLSAVIQPEHIGFSNFLLDISRLVFVYIAVIYMHAGLVGVLFSVFLSRLVKISYLIVKVLIGNRIRVRFIEARGELAKMWLRYYSIPILMIIANNIDNADRFLAPFITRNVESVAYLNIAYSTRGPFATSLYVFMGGLYAKLLREPDGRHVEEVFRLFAFPGLLMIALVFALSKPIVSLLNPAYLSAAYLVIPSSLIFTFMNVELILLGTIMGSERFDEKIRPDQTNIHGMLRKTHTFKAFVIRLTRSLLVLALAGIAVAFIADPLLQATVFVFFKFAGYLIPVIILYYMSKKTINYKIPIRELALFTLAAGITYIVLTILGAQDAISARFYNQLILLVEYMALGILVYIPVTLISPWTRSIVKRTITYAKNIITRKNQAVPQQA